MSRLNLPFDAWPPADKEMWENLFVTGDLFDDQGAFGHVRSATEKFASQAYGRWLSFVARTDPAALGSDPVVRATSARLTDWLEEISELAASSQEIFFSGVLRILKAANSTADWSWHNRMLKILRSRVKASPVGQRKIGRILSSSALVAAGLDLATRRADQASTPLKQMKDRRDGAMIVLLALMPMRCRAFVGLQLESSFLQEGTGYRVSLSEHMTKTGQCWEAQVPEIAADLMSSYLAEIRPAFLKSHGQGHKTLWVTDKGGPYATNYFGRRIRDITLKTLGVPISPHFFRDSAATTLVHTSPENALLARALLAHQSYQTTERHYLQARAVEAGRDYAAILTDLKISDVHRSRRR